MNSFIKFVSVSHTIVLFPEVSDGAVLSVLFMKNMYCLTSSNKITHQTLGFFDLLASTSILPYSVVSHIDVEATLNFMCLLGIAEIAFFFLFLKDSFFFVK